MNETRIYPAYKEAALTIATADRAFYSDEELAFMLERVIYTDPYEFALMELVRQLLHEYQIDFIRWTSEDGVKGYKVATSEESVKITVNRLRGRMRRAVCKERRVLDTVDRSACSLAVQDEYDRQMIRNGMTISFLNKTSLSRCVPGLSVRVDVPRLISPPG